MCVFLLFVLSGTVYYNTMKTPCGAKTSCTQHTCESEQPILIRVQVSTNYIYSLLTLHRAVIQLLLGCYWVYNRIIFHLFFRWQWKLGSSHSVSCHVLTCYQERLNVIMWWKLRQQPLSLAEGSFNYSESGRGRFKWSGLRESIWCSVHSNVILIRVVEVNLDKFLFLHKETESLHPVSTRILSDQGNFS